MRILLLSILMLGAALGLGACRSAPKSSAHLYEGNGPGIRFNESHAGGPLGRD